MQQHEGLADLFVDTLRDIYSAEKQILRSLPKLARAADSETLREAFLTHRDQTEDQIERLDKVFGFIRERPGRKTCEAMQGILDEGEETIADYQGSEALDAGLIAAGQAVEHYEISRYTALRDWAHALGMNEAASLLAETLSEEKETDRLLSEIAESAANELAMGDTARSTAGKRTAGARGAAAASGASSGGTASKPASASGQAAGKRASQSAAAGNKARTASPAAGRSQGTASSGPAKVPSSGSPAGGKQAAGGASATPSAGTSSTDSGMQSGGSQKSPGTIGGRTAGDDEVPSTTRSTPRSG